MESRATATSSASSLRYEQYPSPETIEALLYTTLHIHYTTTGTSCGCRADVCLKCNIYCNIRGDFALALQISHRTFFDGLVVGIAVQSCRAIYRVAKELLFSFMGVTYVGVMISLAKLIL